MNDLISVIVPIYNVQNYLKKCVKSIQNQTYQNIEIVLVDDGATDLSGQICDELQKEDYRIKVVHKENGGLSDARNVGIKQATGKYYFFIDSDDYIHPQMLELLYESLQQNKADVAVCAFQKVLESDHIEPKVLSDVITEVISTEEERIDYFFERNYVEFTISCSKLYPAEYFSDIQYPKGKVHEDEFTTYKLLEKAKRITFIREPLYYYVQRGNSIMGEAFTEKRLHRLEAYQERLNQYWTEKRYVWFEKVLFLYRIFLRKYDEMIETDKKFNKKMLKPYKTQYNHWVYKSIFRLPVSLKSKLGYLAYALVPEWNRKRK